MNPVEEFLGMDKEAGFLSGVKRMFKPAPPAWKEAVTVGAATAGATALATVGAHQLQQGIQAAHDAVAQSMAYKRMLNDNPEMRKMDGKKTRRYFNTMYRMAPDIAKDSFAAGSWVQGVHNMGMDYVNPQMIQALASAEDKLRARRAHPMIDPFQLAQTGVQAGVTQYQTAKERPSLAGKVVDFGGQHIVEPFAEETAKHILKDFGGGRGGRNPRKPRPSSPQPGGGGSSGSGKKNPWGGGLLDPI